MFRTPVRIVVGTLALALVASAQTCPPGTLCPSNTTCPGLVCTPGSFQTSTTVSVSTTALQPPQANQLIAVPRFTPAPNEHLIRAQVDVSAEIVNGSIQARNLTNSPIFNQNFMLQSSVQVYGAFSPTLPPGFSLQPASPNFTTAFAPTTWPGPPANPCDFSGPDSFNAFNLTGYDARRMCLDDPTLLATQFTSAGGLSTVDFTYDSADSSTHSGGGMLCILYLNFTRVTVTITYTYCLSVPTPGQLTCPGDGTQSVACPCGNSGLAARGCANSVAAQGAGLYVVGDPSVDDVMFLASAMPIEALCVLVQGDTALPAAVTFGDGLRCAGGHLTRLYVRNAQNGTLSVPRVHDMPVRARSAQLGDLIPPGATRQYQVVYRDPNAGFCPGPQGGSFNLTNGCSLVWP